MHKLFSKKDINNNENSKAIKDKLNKYSLSRSLQRNINMLKKEILMHDDTVIYRKLKNNDESIEFCLVFIDGMTNREVINQNIIWTLMNKEFNCKDRHLISYIREQVVVADDIQETDDISKIVDSMLYGDSILFVDGYNKALIINTKGWETRSISEPQSETVVTGPREGFNESINTNLSLIRRKITSPDLKFEFKKVGARSKTKVCIAYIDGLVKPKILEEVKRRIDDIDVGEIFSTQVIKELVSDFYLAPFKTVGNTERPDVVASKLLQGRIAILCDGSPVAITLPFIFVEYFQVNEDYYDSYIYASINRLIRIIAFILTITTPAIYVAFVTFHMEMIPTKLVLSIYTAKEGVPMPTAMEAIVMLFIFEIIREAGVRLPKHIGAAVSIVGALVLGDAAVNAKFVSAPIVIVVAIAGISELIMYNMRSSVIVWRLIFLILASILGLYGVIFATMALVLQLISIKTFGIPYMLKLVDLESYDITDTAIRAPWWVLKYRTKFISRDIVRSKTYIKRRNKL